MKNMQETWKDRAKQAMKGRITQTALAEKLGLTQGGLGHWLNGRNEPTLDDINRIADEIGVSRVWLTHGLGFTEGPGKELLDTVLSGTLGTNDLQALAVTAKALTAGKIPAPTEAAEPARGNPDLQHVLQQLMKDPASITPESITMLRNQVERAAQKPKKNNAQTRKKAGGSGA